MMALWCSELSQKLTVKCSGQLEERADLRQELSRIQAEGKHTSVTHVWPVCHWNPASGAPCSRVINNNNNKKNKHHLVKQKRSAERVFTCPPTWAKAAGSTPYWWAMKTEVEERCSWWSSARAAEVLLQTVCYLEAQAEEQTAFV